jgi:hypothetical protein
MLEYHINQKIRRKRFTVNEVATFDFQTSALLSPNGVLKLVRRLHEMMMFCTDVPVDIQDVYLTLPPSDETAASGSDAYFVFSSALAPRERTNNKQPDFLFTIDDVGDDFESFIQEWFAFCESRQAFCGSFFGLASSPPRFLEIRFVWLLRCLLLLASDDASAEEGTRTLSEALNWLLGELSELKEALLSVHPSEFSRAVVEAQSAINRGEPLNNVRIHWLAESLKWTLKGFVLLRFSALKPRAATLLLKNPHLEYAKHQLARELRTGNQARES